MASFLPMLQIFESLANIAFIVRLFFSFYRGRERERKRESVSVRERESERRRDGCEQKKHLIIT